MYTAEVTIRDPMTGEVIVTPATMLAKIPEKYKSYAQDNPLVFTPEKRILSQGEKLIGSLAPRYGTLENTTEPKYIYQVLARTYTQVHVDDLRMSDMTIPSSEDSIIASGTVS